MIDVQHQEDCRHIPIDKVGICNLLYPIRIVDRRVAAQSTVAIFSMSVNPPHDLKGTHMSRFIETLNEYREEFSVNTLPRILEALKRKLAAESAHIEAAFPYFIQRTAPVSGAAGLVDYQVELVAEANADMSDFILSVCVPVTSLCPCSKAISDYGAHNQRGEITIRVRCTTTDSESATMIPIEELVEIAESGASAPVYALLKREDERHVTMQAYQNPAFVEDIVRNVASRLQADRRIVWFTVHALNHESIHNHSAFAQIEWSRP